jgi:P-type E1-E2 ATPase
MDKTGTLTQGNFVLQKVEGGDAVLRLCAGLEQASTHPIAQSIVAGAKERGLQLPEATQAEELAGHGIRGVVEGKKVLCGNEKLMARFGVALPEEKDSARTWVYVAVDGVYAGAVCIADRVKDGSAQAVQELKKARFYLDKLIESFS